MALTTEQLAARRNYIGGSDSPVVVGLSPYKSPYQLWMEKRGEMVDQEETDEMYWGTKLESIIADVWAEKTGSKIRQQPMRVSKEIPFMAVTMDRQIIGDPRGPGYLEIKNFGPWSTGFNKEDQEVADFVQCQVQHGLAVTGYTWGAWACLIGGQRFYHGTVERDQDAIDFLIEAETEFWRMVQEGIQPAIDGATRTTGYIKQLWAADNGQTITNTDPVFLNRAADLMRITEERKAMQEREEEYKNFFRVYMQDNQVLQLPSWGEFRWKLTKPKPKTIFDETAFKEKHPDLYKQFSKKITPNGDRRFTVHPDKKAKEESEES